MKRNWDYYVVGMEQGMQTEEDMSVLEDMEKTVAVVKSVRKVLLAINVHGMTAKKTVETCVEDMRWLQRCDHEMPFPIFLVQMKTSQCLQVEAAAHFWRLLQRPVNDTTKL